MKILQNIFFRKISAMQKNLEIIAYKILYDVVFLILVVLTGMLIMEGLIPGIITRYLKFTPLIIFLFVSVLLIGYWGKKNNLTPSVPRPMAKFEKIIIAVLTIFSAIIIFNSLYGLSLWRMAIILPGILLLIFLLYKIFFEKNNKKIIP